MRPRLRPCAMGLIVLSAAVALLSVLASGLVGRMAEREGHTNLHWYVFSLFCSPLIGCVVVALLPRPRMRTSSAPIARTWSRSRRQSAPTATRI